MTKKDSFHEFVMTEVFHDIEDITSRPMFGDYGVYKDGIFFALIANGELYFKVDSSNQKDFENLGSKPFVYKGHKGKSVTLSYWQLPADIMENAEELKSWVEKSVSAAMSKKK